MALLYLSSSTVTISFLVAFLGALLIQAQDQSGFISIDCGAPADVIYSEPETHINYISDAKFINTGVSKSIEPELKNEYQRPCWTLRSFPERKKNCYKIKITKGSKYLIRTGSLYGNYDGLNKLPQFDIFLGTNRWYTVTISNASLSEEKEIIHVASKDSIRICLVNTGHGTPFISYIELRTLNHNIYLTDIGSLEMYHRWDLGSNQTYRYKYDVYDRFWSTHGDNNDWIQLSDSNIPADFFGNNSYKMPAIVMRTAVTPANASAPLIISWKPENPTDKFYAYLHFMEIEVLAKNQTREFNILRNGETRYHNLSPQYQNVSTIYSTRAFSGEEIKYSLEMTKRSTLPPIINAMEIYRVIDFKKPHTSQGDGNPPK